MPLIYRAFTDGRAVKKELHGEALFGVANLPDLSANGQGPFNSRFARAGFEVVLKALLKGFGG